MVESRVKVREYTKLSQRKRKLKFIAILLVVGVFIGLFIYFLTSSKYQISQIKLIGVETLNDEEIIDLVSNEMRGKYLFLFPKNNILLYPSNSIYDLVKNYSHKIKSVDMYRSGLRTIKISIVERRPAYLFCQSFVGKDCYFADEDGYIYASAPIFSDPVYIEFQKQVEDENVLGKRVSSRDSFERIKMMIMKLTEVNIDPERIVFMNESDLFIDTNKGWQIRVNYENDIEESINNLATALLSDALSEDKISSKGGLEYVDLRFDKKVFTKFREAE